MPQHAEWHHWTEQDDADLVKWAGTKPDHVIAHLLGRTRSAVRQRAAKNGLSLCFGRTWEPVRSPDVRTAAELRRKHRFATDAAKEMGIPYYRFRLMIKYAKEQGLL